MNTTSAVEKREKAVDYVSDEGIKVRVSYPDDVPETIRQQKINKMYDISSLVYQMNLLLLP
ncbi:hypothetical protein [Ruminococcus flavefaciens]|uniref:hypothetical protein n=1 Tax=Ruminococcus flavefaciens TaxID=1265 RepID=UPI0026EC2EAD|nr:hypothetical protein [Ruminococcus flavefaciens]